MIPGFLDIPSLLAQTTVQAKLRACFLILAEHTPESFEEWALFYNESPDPRIAELNRNMVAMLMAGAELVRAGNAYSNAVNVLKETPPAPGG